MAETSDPRGVDPTIALGYEWVLRPCAWEDDRNIYIYAGVMLPSGQDDRLRFFQASEAFSAAPPPNAEESVRQAWLETRTAIKRRLKEQLRAWFYALGTGDQYAPAVR